MVLRISNLCLSSVSAGSKRNWSVPSSLLHEASKRYTVGMLSCRAGLNSNALVIAIFLVLLLDSSPNVRARREVTGSISRYDLD